MTDQAWPVLQCRAIARAALLGVDACSRIPCGQSLVRAGIHEVGEAGVSEPFLMHIAKMDDGIDRSLLLPREWHLSPLALAKRVLLAPRPVSLSNDATLRARARGIVLDCIRTIWFRVWSERVLHAIK